ncbi:hypothetical protein KPH14_003112 [Odynerus spinipes]|uniref:Uncharacterized protein n=1 Tax=Odynerus spinipes TaxID=1348599 RepID=A0AAD9RWV0_9HYME|nr:hypothetical protein KPH14_003112 [Odynerus spinipes]
MMGNMSDLYYLLQLILPEVFLYTRDTILHEFPWLAKTNDDMDDLESKMRGNTSRHISLDMLALSSVCALFVIILIIFGKCFKNESDHYPAVPSVPIPTDLPMVYPQCSEKSINTGIMDPLHACGDTFFNQEIHQSNIPFESEFTKSQQSDNSNFPGSSNSTSSLNFPSCSNFPLTKTRSDHSQHSQSTQTNHRIFKKAARSQGWLIRRTRSGLVYGKYPL